MGDSIDALVSYATNLDLKTIPQSVMRYSRDLFQDAIACILSGSSAKGIAELREITHVWGGAEQATVLAFNEQTSAPSAAFLNAVMCHANDYDDTHDGAVNHGCVVVVPALLAACEAMKNESGLSISGKEFIAALAVGLDITNRLGMAFIPYLHVGWLPTTLWGPFAGAAACGRLLHLDEEQMRNAFGLAYAQIHGNRQGLVDGALSKRIQPAFSATAGLQAAFFAARGISGARHIIDGEFGIPALYTDGKVNKRYLSEGLGSVFETTNISIKPYPCCRCSHPVIDAALSLKGQGGFDWQQIRRGEIYLTPQSMGQIGSPFEIRTNPTVDAQFSAQYTAALAFIAGWPRVTDFEEDNIKSRKDIPRLASRFQVFEFEKDRSSIVPMEMRIFLEGQGELSVRIEEPKGSPQNPMSKEALSTKFNFCLDNAIKEYSQQERNRILLNLEAFTGIPDVADWISTL